MSIKTGDMSMPARYTLSNYRRQRIKDAATNGAMRVLLVALPKIVRLLDCTGAFGDKARQLLAERK